MCRALPWIAGTCADVQRADRTGAPGDHKRPTARDSSIVRDRKRARAELPTLRPELLLQAEPVPVTITVPCEPAALPMLAVKAVLLLTVPPLAIVSVPKPELPMLRPPPGLLFQVNPPGHYHRTLRAGIQSDEPPPALLTSRRSGLSGCPCQRRRPRWFRCLSS